MTSEQQIAAGALFLTSDTNRVLLQLRASWKSSHRNEWSLFGGLAKNDETPSEAMRRECTEEMGMFPEVTKIYPFDIYESKDKGFRYYTFIVIVDKEFQPTINRESAGYAWVNIGVWPKPLHQGAYNTLMRNGGTEKLEKILDIARV